MDLVFSLNFYSFALPANCLSLFYTFPSGARRFSHLISDKLLWFKSINLGYFLYLPVFLFLKYCAKDVLLLYRS